MALVIVQPVKSQETVIITKADGTSQLIEVFEDWNLSTSEYPQFLLFTQNGDLLEVYSQTDERLSIWYMDREPAVDQLLGIFFQDSVWLEATDLNLIIIPSEDFYINE